jgi:hypothetical protein
MPKSFDIIAGSVFNSGIVYFAFKKQPKFEKMTEKETKQAEAESRAAKDNNLLGSHYSSGAINNLMCRAFLDKNGKYLVTRAKFQMAEEELADISAQNQIKTTKPNP